MNVNQFSLAGLVTSAATGLSVLIATGAVFSSGSEVAIAQATNADALFQNAQSGENNSDPFSTQGNGQMNSVFDLIHQVTFGAGRSATEFQEEQREVINTEAADFRTRQLELLQQQSGSPAAPGQN